MEWQHHLHAVQDQAPVITGILYIPVCIRDGCLLLSYKENKWTGNEMLNLTTSPTTRYTVKSSSTLAPHEDLITTVKKRKRRLYGHITWSDNLVKIVLQGTVVGRRRRGRQVKVEVQYRWMDKEIICRAPCSDTQQRQMEETGGHLTMSVPQWFLLRLGWKPNQDRPLSGSKVKSQKTLAGICLRC